MSGNVAGSIVGAVPAGRVGLLGMETPQRILLNTRHSILQIGNLGEVVPP